VLVEQNSLLNSFVRVVFYTSAIRNAFFHKLPNIHFCKHFLQISHNLKTINGQIINLDTLAKLFQTVGDRPASLTRLSNLLTLEHQASVKTEQMNYETSPQLFCTLYLLRSQN